MFRGDDSLLAKSLKRDECGEASRFATVSVGYLLLFLFDSRIQLASA